MDENMNEGQDQQFEDQEDNAGNLKQWIQDNLRIIISVAIVIAIAGGIYSYSKRSEVDVATTPLDEEELLLDEGFLEIEEGEEVVIDGEDVTEEAEEIAEEEAEEAAVPTEEEVTSVAVSQETGESFIESAQAGEGTTHLARRALSDFLEKNPDSELLPEHKIYIEDYLRKNVGFQGSVHVGTSVEFSKDLIQGAINSAKQLNDAQINNLHKYVVLVPSLT